MFCLHFSRLDEPFCGSHEEILVALDPYASADRRDHWQSGPFQAFQAHLFNTPASERENFPCFSAESGAMCLAWARLDNRVELADRLGFSSSSLAETSDSHLILRAWERWRQQCVEQLIGDFSFVIVEPKARLLFCARDHFGVRPLYYTASDQEVVVATSLPALLQASRKEYRPDQEWLARYLTSTSMDYTETAWKGVFKLAPGQQMLVNQSSLSCHSYFDFTTLADIPQQVAIRPTDGIEAYRQQLMESVSCRLVSSYPVGSELSGGLDSASITAMAAKELQRRGKDLDVFSFAAFELEPVFADAVCQRWGLQRRHRFSRFAPEPLEAELVRAPVVLGSPSEHPSATFHESFYQRAEEVGVRTLLSGFGGDEFVTNPAGLGLVAAELLSQSRYGDLWPRLPGGFLHRLRSMLRLIRQQRNKQPSVKIQRITQQFRNRWDLQLVRPGVARKFQLEERFFAPLRFDSEYSSLRDYIVGARWQPGIPTRLENCSLMARSHQLEYRWPLLDVRLVELFLSLPAELTYDRGLDRNLHRQAVNDVVPEMILRQPGKDVGPPRPIPDHVKNLCPYREEASLHPMLRELIDESVYREQCRQLAQGVHAIGLEQWLQLYQNVHAVSQAHCWLDLWATEA